MSKINAFSKKILCYNMLNSGKCKYGNECMYAHTLKEQKINPLRHKVYTIIKTVDDLSNIDIYNDTKLYNSLLQLTHVCQLCLAQKCPGGYNCKNGAINLKYKICHDDLVYGTCTKKCDSVHLTKKGIVPYVKQQQANKQPDQYKSYNYNCNVGANYAGVVSNGPIVSNGSNGSNGSTGSNSRHNICNIKGILLTDEFVQTLTASNQKSNKLYDQIEPKLSEGESTDEDDDNDIYEETIEYMNNDNININNPDEPNDDVFGYLIS